MEQEQPHNITRQPQTTHHHDQLRITNLGRLHNPADRLERNGQAEREQKDTVDERTEDLGALPAVRVDRRGRGGGEFDGVQSYDEGEDVTAWSVTAWGGRCDPRREFSPLVLICMHG